MNRTCFPVGFMTIIVPFLVIIDDIESDTSILVFTPWVREF